VLGAPDATGGVYLTFVARVAASGEDLVAAYRLRVSPPASAIPPNQNPVITGVAVIDAAGWSPLDETAPRIVHAGDRLGLAVGADPDSDESYPSPVGTQPGGYALENLRASWFATAGDISDPRTSNANPGTVLTLEKNLPPPGSEIDIYVVIRDERGGTDWAMRRLLLE
jgi:hypothetical protein